MVRYDSSTGSVQCVAIPLLVTEKMLPKVSRARRFGPYLDKSPLDSSPRPSEQKKRCCKTRSVARRPCLNESSLKSSPRSSEQKRSLKSVSSAVRHAVQPAMFQRLSNQVSSSPKLPLHYKRADNGRRTWLILLIHIDTQHSISSRKHVRKNRSLCKRNARITAVF